MIIDRIKRLLKIESPSGKNYHVEGLSGSFSNLSEASIKAAEAFNKLGHSYTTAEYLEGYKDGERAGYSKGILDKATPNEIRRALGLEGVEKGE